MLRNLATKGATAALQGCGPRILLDLTTAQPNFCLRSCPSSYSPRFSVHPHRSRVSVYSDDRNELFSPVAHARCASSAEKKGTGEKHSAFPRSSSAKYFLRYPPKNKWLPCSEFDNRPAISLQNASVPAKPSYKNTENAKELSQISQARFRRRNSPSQKNAGKNEITAPRNETFQNTKKKKLKHRLERFSEEHDNIVNTDSSCTQESAPNPFDAQYSETKPLCNVKGYEQPFTTCQAIIKDTNEKNRIQNSSVADDSLESNVGLDETDIEPRKIHRGTAKSFNTHNDLIDNNSKTRVTSVETPKQELTTNSNNAIASLLVEKLREGIMRRRMGTAYTTASNNQTQNRLYGVREYDFTNNERRGKQSARSAPKRHPKEKAKRIFKKTTSLKSISTSSIKNKIKDFPKQHNRVNSSHHNSAFKTNINIKEDKDSSSLFNQKQSSNDTPKRISYLFTDKFHRNSSQGVAMFKKPPISPFDEYDDINSMGVSEGLLPFTNASVGLSLRCGFVVPKHANRPQESKSLLTKKKILPKNPSNSMSVSTVDSYPLQMNIPYNRGYIGYNSATTLYLGTSDRNRGIDYAKVESASGASGTRVVGAFNARVPSSASSTRVSNDASRTRGAGGVGITHGVSGANTTHVVDGSARGARGTVKNDGASGANAASSASVAPLMEAEMMNSSGVDEVDGASDASDGVSASDDSSEQELMMHAHASDGVGVSDDSPEQELIMHTQASRLSGGTRSTNRSGGVGGMGNGRGGSGYGGDSNLRGFHTSSVANDASGSGGSNKSRQAVVRKGDNQSPETKPLNDHAGLNSETFLYGVGSTYLEETYEIWRKNPEAVHASWDVFFRQVKNGAPPGEAYCSPPGIRPRSTSQPTKRAPAEQKAVQVHADQKTIMQQLALQQITQHYQADGHFLAEVDPLQYQGSALGTKFVKATDRQLPEAVKQMLDANQMTNMKEQYLIPLNSTIGKSGEKMLPLQEILNRLQDVYCRYIGIEYMHIPSLEKKQWIREQFEPGIKYLTKNEKEKLCRRLICTSAFEEFLSRKWPTLFRFSVEGCEIAVPALHQIVDKFIADGTDHFVFGMAHRGRLNVIANLLNKEIDKLLLHFKKDINFDKHLGDVKYHLGCYVTQKHEETNKDFTICILSNASHLESVNPMVQGRCKAEQVIHNDDVGKKVVPIIVHGDAAYAGQGVVYEQNTMCTLPNYNVNGTLHLVINNNIGFTTPPEESRSSPYCTDVAKLVHAPVFHVNSEKPDEVIHCINVACAYRNRFQSDVVVDLVCYRRYGHNEADEPAFTSPILYSNIRKHKSFTETYTEQLITEKVITQELVDKEREEYFKRCEEAYKTSEKYTSIDWRDWNDSPWKDFAKGSLEELIPTGVSENVLTDIAKKSITLPDGFIIHKLLERAFRNRKKMIADRKVDWALAETLAYGTLLQEGVLVRLSGQDSQRGTFSHRHHVLHHQQKDHEIYVPLNHLSDKQGKYYVINSPLIEYGALAFEIGFAMSFSNAFVVFESQYGDFLNNAQTIIDVYLSSAESKWGRQCGLVLLVPHGLEGMGSEHSSAHLERFLQLSSEDPDLVHVMNKPEFSFNQLKNTNWIIANCTTPANFFHILRRQIALPFRKPLVIMSPKSLLRHPECKSSFDEMTENTTFQSVIPDMGPASHAPESVRKHILCTGKVYYDLKEARKNHDLESSIAITRIEQLCPFPFNNVWQEIEKYSQSEICWAQEEHKNQGSWNYILERFSALLCKTKWCAISYAGRSVSPVPAVATPHKHNQEKGEFLEAAMITSEDATQRGIKCENSLQQENNEEQ